MQVSDFYYELPRELIAQEPPPERGGSRMLVVSRESKSLRDDVFRNFPCYIRPGDCLVLNNTRVFPARLHGRRNRLDGAEVEIFLLEPRDAEHAAWRCLAKPAKRVKAGDWILFGETARARVSSEEESGERILEFQTDALELAERIGEMPLPPYIERGAKERDKERYQTVFARESGSVAAPTAGLHFTPEILAECRAAGASVVEVTLHVGQGTFAPLRAEKLEDVRLHKERYEIGEEAARTMQAAKRLFCVGTTSVRTLESAMITGGFAVQRGHTSLFISPGFRFRAAGALLTNFHLPASSLLMLVSAFAGRELIFDAYRHAVSERYRFFSYGDCMLIE